MAFDPIREVRFRGKAIPDLTREEMQEALVSALKALRHMERASQAADLIQYLEGN